MGARLADSASPTGGAAAAAGGAFPGTSPVARSSQSAVAAVAGRPEASPGVDAYVGRNSPGRDAAAAVAGA